MKKYFLLILIVLSVALAAGNYNFDDDHHPQGDETTDYSRYDGYINKLLDLSDQLQPGMATTTYGLSDPASDPDSLNGQVEVDSRSDAKWHDSIGSNSRADQYAITKYRSWSISNRGNPFPPGPPESRGEADGDPYSSQGVGGTYYHRDYSGFRRTRPTDNSVSKTVKVMGNSFAAVADASMTDENGNEVSPGDGVWIDPDGIKKLSEDGTIKGDWKDMLVYNIDITGPDSGLGLFTGKNKGVNIPSGHSPSDGLMYGNIYFKGENDGKDNNGDLITDKGWNDPDVIGETVSQIEPPMCGDDRKEFLVEEMGETERSARFTGKFGCTNVRNTCVDTSSSGSKFVPEGETSNMDEKDEDLGRLKDDREVCLRDTPGEQLKWYDQDFGDADGDGEQETCQENNLYGEEGVSWIDKAEVKRHPTAFVGGIDDDWNQYLENEYLRGEHPKNYSSRPEKSSWDFSSESPVPTGSPNKSIATLGFCGGDDEGEHLVTQECNTGLCETDRSIRGVAKVPGSCVFERDREDRSSSYPVEESFTDENSRKLYQPGEKITFNLDEPRTIACFNGVWYEEWPVSIGQEKVEIPLGQSLKIPFSVVNVRDSPMTFEVKMEDPGESKSAYQFTNFVEKDGDSFTTQVPAQSSRQFNLEITGGVEELGENELFIEAEGKNTGVFGEDSLTVEVVEAAKGTTVEAPRQEPESVPGIGTLHLMVIMLMGSLIYAFRN